MSVQKQQTQNIGKNNDVSKKKNIVIVLLSIVILLLISYIVINSSTRTSSFLSDYISLQNKLSYYVAKINAETFEAYSNTNIITAYSGDTLIMDFDNKELVALADKSDTIDKDNTTYYKLNVSNVKEKLNVDLTQYSNISFYVSDNLTIKVKLTEQPKWWDTNFDLLKI